MVHVNVLGKVHYAQFSSLRLLGFVNPGLGLEQLYAQETGLEFDLNHLEEVATLILRNSLAFNPLFWDVGQQEMEKFSPSNAIPREQQMPLIPFAIAATVGM